MTPIAGIVLFFLFKKRLSIGHVWISKIKWTPVSTAVPPEGVTVLVYDGIECSVLTIDSANQQIHRNGAQFAFTHWMPLPSPPDIAIPI
ncbi:DUF551 domain-containing protein [Phytohalomonas tamaricis]|uniref:DUF551 domain-containing protein n=1 Tax=Phytohalomonas tamaricis TaxID=2081032 RepID=UPI00374E1E06